MFNPWKQKRESMKIAELHYQALEDSGQWFTEAEQSGDAFTNCVDDNDNIYYYAKSVHTLYDTIQANRNEFLTALENDIIATLNRIVDNAKNISLTDLLNQPIVVRYDPNNGAMIMPQYIRFYDLGNGKIRIGQAVA